MNDSEAHLILPMDSKSADQQHKRQRSQNAKPLEDVITRSSIAAKISVGSNIQSQHEPHTGAHSLRRCGREKVSNLECNGSDFNHLVNLRDNLVGGHINQINIESKEVL